jgi:hypothetical protein
VLRNGSDPAIGDRATGGFECDERPGCMNCLHPEEDHVENKCLYAPGMYQPGVIMYDANGRPVTPDRFNEWLAR